jgi:hypothetical protein
MFVDVSLFSIFAPPLLNEMAFSADEQIWEELYWECGMGCKDNLIPGVS